MLKEAGKGRESRPKRTKKWLILFKMEYYLFEDFRLVLVLESVRACFLCLSTPESCTDGPESLLPNKDHLYYV